MKRLALAILLLLGGLVSAVCVAGVLYRPPPTIPPGFVGAIMDVDGVPLRVVQEGSGHDILMIHGSPGILEDFDAQARELRTTFRVTRYDRPGMGFSGDGADHSPQYNARVALALMEKLGLEHVVVVGHSFGGATALAIGLKKSPRVAALVVLDSAVYAPIRPVNTMYRFLRLPAFGTGLGRVMPKGIIAAKVGQQIVEEFKAGQPPDGFVATRIGIFSEPKVLHEMANEHWLNAEHLALQNTHYGEIDLPLYIVAQRDDPARAATARKLQSDVKGAEVQLVSPSGHYVQIEQAATVADVIRRAAAGAPAAVGKGHQ